MQVSDWIQTVAAVLVFLALILNVLQLRHVANQSTAFRQTLEQGAYGSLVDKHMGSGTTYFLNDDEELLAWYLSTRGYKSTSAEKNRRRLYVIIKLESHENNFLSHTAGLLNDEVWAAWRAVMEDDFTIDEYQEVWPVAKKFYAASFVTFVDDQIMPTVKRECSRTGVVQQIAATGEL